MYLLDWSVDSRYRAKLFLIIRGSPGDTDMVYMTPVSLMLKQERRSAKMNC